MHPRSRGNAALLVVAIVLAGACLRVPLTAQALPPEDAGCVAAIGKGEVRLFANLRISPTFQNQTPPRWKCQAEQRAMPICARPQGRVCIAVWAVDPQTHANVAGVRFTIDGTSKTTTASGLVTFTPLRNDPMTLTMDRVPTAYVTLGIPLVKPVTTLNGLVIAELTKK